MSTAHAAPPAGDHAHDDHAHDFDGEPIQALPADEPRTPSWLPILGLLLFVTAGVGLLITSDKPDEGAVKTATASASAPPEAAPAASAQAVNPPVRLPIRPSPNAQPPANPAPAASGLEPALRQLTPEQIQGLQKQFEQARGKHAPGAADTAKPAAPPGTK
jgi:hypothetical protein